MVSTSRWQKLMAGSSWHGTHGNPGWFNWILIQKSIWLRYVMLGWFMGGVDLTGIYRQWSFKALCLVISRSFTDMGSNPAHYKTLSLMWERDHQRLINVHAVVQDCLIKGLTCLIKGLTSMSSCVFGQWYHSHQVTTTKRADSMWGIVYQVICSLISLCGERLLS